jgi:hypothetical protein
VTDGDPPPPVPTPPPGPGVRAPFAAAPVEGRGTWRWLGLGVAGAVAALCCGVGVLVLGGLAVTGIPAVNERAHRAVGDYLDAKVAGDWQAAYEQRCEPDRRTETLDDFTDRVSSGPRIEAYQLGTAILSEDGVRLPVTVDLDDGSRDELVFPLAEDPGTGRLEVCGRVG